MQYDPITGETPAPDERWRDPWSSQPQSPRHAQSTPDWPSQPGHPSGSTDPRMAPYISQQPRAAGSAPSAPAQSPGYPSSGAGYGYPDQAGLTGGPSQGRSVFDQPSGTGEYAQPGWQQPSPWAPAGPSGQRDESGWQTGQQPVYGGPPTQAWGTGERPALELPHGYGQPSQQRYGSDYGQGHGQGNAQDYGQDWGRQPAQEYGRDHGQAYRQDYGQDYGAGQGGSVFDQGGSVFDQGEYRRAEDQQGGYGQGGYGYGQQAAGAAYPGYQQATAGPVQPATQPGQSVWGDAGYGTAVMGGMGGVATQSPSSAGAPAGAPASDQFPGDWPADGGWGYPDQGPADRQPPDQLFGQPRLEPQAAESNGTAVGALIAALAGFVIPIVAPIVAFVLAAKASRRINESRGAVGGRGLIVAARVIAVVALAFAVIGGLLVVTALREGRDGSNGAAGSGSSGSAATGEPSANSRSSAQPDAARVVSLKIGECIADTPKSQVTNVKVVACSAKHETEVFANVKVEDQRLPSEKALDSLAEKRCVSAFRDYVGVEYNASALNIRYFTPTEESWAAGDRSITCTLTGGTPGEKLTGSKRDSKE